MGKYEIISHQFSSLKAQSTKSTKLKMGLSGVCINIILCASVLDRLAS